MGFVQRKDNIKTLYINWKRPGLLPFSVLHESEKMFFQMYLRLVNVSSLIRHRVALLETTALLLLLRVFS